jgi:hypothetical protein
MSRQAMAVNRRVHLGNIKAFVIEGVPRKTSVGAAKKRCIEIRLAAITGLL